MDASVSPTGLIKLRRTRTSGSEQQRPRPRQPCVEKQQYYIPRRNRQRCVCLPGNYTPPQFPSVWSELRFALQLLAIAGSITPKAGLRTTQQLCDGSIKCGEEHIYPVHRAILSAASPYFKALFTSCLNPGAKAELTIPDAPADIFSLILDYAYTGSCPVNAENVERLLPLADRFQVFGVIQLCCQFLLGELKPDNCLGIYKFARHYFCRDLEERGRKYIRQNFKEIVQESAEFRELACEELMLILRDDDLNARSEELVFEAIKTWVEVRPNERSANLPRLLSCPRYGLMRPQYFTDKVFAWSLAQNQECKDILLPVVAYLEERSKKQCTNQYNHRNDELSRPRVPHEILFAMGGWSCGSPTNFVETYDTRADRWFLSSHTDVTPRAYHGTCSLNNIIYIIGGFDGDKYSNTVRCFDPLKKEWRERACMYQARCYVSVCTYGGKIYALGGNNGVSRMSSCERYDPEANQWELISPMKRQRSDASAAVLRGRIYIVGGFDGQQVHNSAEVYDISTDQWSFLAPMHEPRTGVSLVAFRDCLYAIGGFNGYVRLSSGEKYNPNQLDKWQEVAEMFNPRSNFTVAVLDDMIFAIGGFNGYLPVDSVECYDPDNNLWYGAAPMNLRRSALSACVVGGLANIREYSHNRQKPGPWLKPQQKPKDSSRSVSSVIG